MPYEFIEGELPHGTDICKCPTCGLVFNSARAFDKHRVGKYMPDERRCLTVIEMSDKGMVLNKRSRWITQKQPDNIRKV